MVCVKYTSTGVTLYVGADGSITKSSSTNTLYSSTTNPDYCFGGYSSSTDDFSGHMIISEAAVGKGDISDSMIENWYFNAKPLTSGTPPASGAGGKVRMTRNGLEVSGTTTDEAIKITPSSAVYESSNGGLFPFTSGLGTIKVYGSSTAATNVSGTFNMSGTSKDVSIDYANVSGGWATSCTIDLSELGYSKYPTVFLVPNSAILFETGKMTSFTADITGIAPDLNLVVNFSLESTTLDIYWENDEDSGTGTVPNTSTASSGLLSYVNDTETTSGDNAVKNFIFNFRITNTTVEES